MARLLTVWLATAAPAMAQVSATLPATAEQPAPAGPAGPYAPAGPTLPAVSGVLPPPGPLPEAIAPPPGAVPETGIVLDVRIVGNQSVSLQKIASNIRTRPGRPFDPQLVEDDVRRLNKTRWFVNVDTTYQRTPQGTVVIFRVVERPTIKYVKYVGSKIARRHLDKQTNLKPGDAIDPYMVEEGRRRLVEYYQSKGYSNVSVTVFEGAKPGDQGVVYVIHEGQKQRVWHVDFVGNTIASDARLRTQISSKPPILYLFKGEVDREKIDADVQTLTAYYRSLGYFRARIGRELEFDEDNEWLTLRFVIDEGPRYVVRNVSVIGNTKFGTEQLTADLKLKPGQYFDQSAMTHDVSAMTDVYGAAGYVFADVKADPRFLEEPGQLDLVYQITEGKRYRVGRIDVRIEGENPRTRRHAVLNRISLQPGDIVDMREIRASERRLRASGLFLVDPAQGVQPKIVFEEPKLGDTETEVANDPDRPSGFRGQSPDPGAADEGWLVIGVDGALLAEGVPPPAAGPTASWWHRLPLPFRPAAEVAPPSAAEADVRMQSPDGRYAATGAYYPPAPQVGQVPMGRRDPGSDGGVRLTGGAGAAPAGGYAPGSMIPVQYAAPAYPPVPGYGPPPGYGTSPASPAGQGFPAAPGYNTMPGAPPAAGYPAATPYPTHPGYAATQPPTSAPGTALPGPLPPPQGFSPAPTAVPPPPLPTTGGYDDPIQLFPRGNDSPFLDEQPYAGAGDPTLDLTGVVQETQTGRFMLGVGVNSNAGVVGNIVIDEQNFDWRRWPRSWREVIDGTAFRGDGQQFRIELVPGNELQRYAVTFRQPYLFDTRVALGLSGFYFDRFYRDWDENRLGGRVSLGYQFTPDLSGTVAFRGENVKIRNPRVPTVPQLADVLGDNSLFSVSLGLAHDTRDNQFLATEGHLIQFGFEQVFGEFDYPRFTFEGQQHFLIHERPDGSGRQVLTLSTNVGISGSQTPIFENFFAGGFSTLRGFNFRQAGPLLMDTYVGGRFQWINSVEYLFPLTADDMIRGVVFCDFGTVEQDIELHASNFRVSPGLGLRVTVPAMGPAPIALDFAVPVVHADGDNIQNFSFFVGFGR